MADRDEGFFHRWSRLKRGDTRKVAEPQEELQSAEQPREPAGPEDSPAEATAQPVAEPDLPPIDSLDRESDYSVFMRAGVAPELRNQALRKLWRSDPVFANLDGLLEYGEDFSEPFKRGGVVPTLYRVGKGMMSAEDEPATEVEPSGAGEASPPEDASPVADVRTSRASDEIAADAASAKASPDDNDEMS